MDLFVETIIPETLTDWAFQSILALLHRGIRDTINWGNTAGTMVGGTGNGSAQTLTVYGEVPAGQAVTPGAYVDTITATITY